MISTVFITLNLILMGGAENFLSLPCFQRREVSIIFDHETWVMDQGHLFAEMASILRVVQRNKCSEIFIIGHQKSMRVNEQVTEEYFVQILYIIMNKDNKVSQSEIIDLAEKLPNRISNNIDNKTKHTFFLLKYREGNEWRDTLKMLQQKG